MSRTALIVGDTWHGRNVLGAVRGLARAGWVVDVAAPSRGLAGSSRHVRRRIHLVAPATDFAAFTDGLTALAAPGTYDVVFPAGDAEVLAMSRIGHVPGTTIPLAPYPQTLAALDKLHLDAVATQAGFASLGTRVVSVGDRHVAQGRVAVKARWHWTPDYRGGTGRLDALVTDDPARIATRVAEIEALGGEATVQEAVDGDAIAYVGVIGRDGREIVGFQQRGIGHWPTPAGVWTRVETMPLDEELARRSRDVLTRLGWLGLVQLQYLVPPDGVPRLIDLNGRFYASLGLAVSAGINLPELWAAAALDQGTPSGPTMPPDRRYQWLEGDVLRALHERRGGLARDLADTVAYRRGTVHSTWRRDDPRPAIARIGHLVTGITRPRR